MRKLCLLLSIALLLSCNTVSQQKQPKNPQFEGSTEEGFMEFFERFMFEEEFQLYRTIFPIQVEGKDISKPLEWTHIPFYRTEEFYPILHPSHQTFFEEDLPTTTLTASILSFASQKRTDYNFRKGTRGWYLKAIEQKELFNGDHQGEGFWKYLNNFATDSLFQVQHVSFPLKSGFLDDDFEPSSVLLKLENWTFELISLEGMMAFDFGHESTQKHVYLRGVENGITVQYFFEKVEGMWMLVRGLDYST